MSRGTKTAQAQAAGTTGAWRTTNRIQLAELLGVHQDTVTEYAREGMPVLRRGGAGKEGAYDAVDCLSWWRERQGKNAKEAAQTRLYENNADLAEIKIAKEEGALLSREDVVSEGQSVIKGWTAMVRALPRQARHNGFVVSAEAEAGLTGLCRHILTEISSWKVVADIKRSTKTANAA